LAAYRNETEVGSDLFFPKGDSMAEIIERDVRPVFDTESTPSGRGIKLWNEYLGVLTNGFYQNTPKAVFAAIAVSLATSGGDRLEEAQAEILKEWKTLFEAGIVPQDPTKYLK
jgi:hypothetical protein